MKYICSATEQLHGFQANPDPERVPNHFGYFVCKEHLAAVNECRRDKGFEELVVYPDSYGENQ